MGKGNSEASDRVWKAARVNRALARHEVGGIGGTNAEEVSPGELRPPGLSVFGRNTAVPLGGALNTGVLGEFLETGEESQPVKRSVSGSATRSRGN